MAPGRVWMYMTSLLSSVATLVVTNSVIIHLSYVMLYVISCYSSVIIIIMFLVSAVLLTAIIILTNERSSERELSSGCLLLGLYGMCKLLKEIE